MKTKVKFYFEIPDFKGYKSVFAVFPEIDERHGAKLCYAHIGQHSAACEDYISECVECTDPNDYLDLKNELINHCGYDLEILNNCENTVTL